MHRLCVYHMENSDIDKGGKTMNLSETDAAYYAQGFQYVAGIDEAGRGPLAGPVCAAAVILPPGLILDGVNDSKKLSEKKREALYDVIAQNALCWSYAFVDAPTIDQINIRQATHLAMENAVKKLSPAADFLLIDGNDKIPFSVLHAYLVKGDAKSQSIAAASIMAKVTRDRYMKEMAKEYPEYAFEKHKGYGTKVHMEAIRAYGLTPLHRVSFMTDKVLGKV